MAVPRRGVSLRALMVGGSISDHAEQRTRVRETETGDIHSTADGLARAKRSAPMCRIFDTDRTAHAGGTDRIIDGAT
jgi:hypothetical protein